MGLIRYAAAIPLMLMIGSCASNPIPKEYRTEPKDDNMQFIRGYSGAPLPMNEIALVYVFSLDRSIVLQIDQIEPATKESSTIFLLDEKIVNSWKTGESLGVVYFEFLPGTYEVRFLKKVKMVYRGSNTPAPSKHMNEQGLWKVEAGQRYVGSWYDLRENKSLRRGKTIRALKNQRMDLSHTFPHNTVTSVPTPDLVLSK